MFSVFTLSSQLRDVSPQHAEGQYNVNHREIWKFAEWWGLESTEDTVHCGHDAMRCDDGQPARAVDGGGGGGHWRDTGGGTDKRGQPVWTRQQSLPRQCSLETLADFLIA